MKTVNTMSIIALVVMLQGCLAVSIKKKVVSDESSRISITFESAAAAAIFNSKTAQKNYVPEDPCVGKTTFGIPFIVLIDHTIYFETVCFNRNAKLADVNGDGMITLEEANNL